MERDLIPIAFYCPECPPSDNIQRTTLRRSVVIAMLANGEDIRVMGGKCRHISSLPPVARETLRVQLAGGALIPPSNN